MTDKNKLRQPYSPSPASRGPGAPLSAVPAIASLIFLAMIAPIFYALYPLMVINANATDIGWLNNLLIITIAWIVIFLGAIFYPAIRGKHFALGLIRYISIIAIIGYGLALLADLAAFSSSPANRHAAIVAFWLPLIELAPAAWLLFNGLRHEPWFNPDASAAQIGPSANTKAGLYKQAGLDPQGKLPSQMAAQMLSYPEPPTRFLCFAVPALALWSMKHYPLAALSGSLCIAALFMAIVIPIRALIVYALMGALADWVRGKLQTPRDAPRAQTGP